MKHGIESIIPVATGKRKSWGRKKNIRAPKYLVVGNAEQHKGQLVAYLAFINHLFFTVKDPGGKKWVVHYAFESAEWQPKEEQ